MTIPLFDVPSVDGDADGDAPVEAPWGVMATVLHLGSFSTLRESCEIPKCWMVSHDAN